MNPFLSWSEPAAPIEVTSDVVKTATDTGCRKTILELLTQMSQLRIAHWQASTKTNEHAALGELYETLDGLVDTFTETLMGLEQSRSMPDYSGELKGEGGYETLLKDIRATVDRLTADASKLQAPDLQNITADMTQAVNKAYYLLLS